MSSEMTSPIAAIESIWPFDRWSRHPVLIAVSGGPDSVVLLHAMKTIADHRPCRMMVGHIDHGLRQASTEEAQWVEGLAGELAIPCFVRKLCLSEASNRRGEGLEGMARQARYAALRAIAVEQGARTIVTAHTRNDQVETILFRLLRGTGIHGLQGMTHFRELEPGLTLARPMLDVTRDAVLAYLRDHGLNATQDESNHDLNMSRNRLRRQILPLLSEHFPWPIEDNLLNLSETAAEYEAFLQQAAEEAADKVVQECSADSIQLSADGFRSLPDLVRRAILRNVWRNQCWPEQQMNRQAWQAIVAAILIHAEHASAPTGLASHQNEVSPIAQQMFPGGIQLRRVDDRIELFRSESGSETLRPDDGTRESYIDRT